MRTESLHVASAEGVAQAESVDLLDGVSVRFEVRQRLHPVAAPGEVVPPGAVVNAIRTTVRTRKSKRPKQPSWRTR